MTAGEAAERGSAENAAFGDSPSAGELDAGRSSEATISSAASGIAPSHFEAPRLDELLPIDALKELASSFEKMTGLAVYVRSLAGTELLGPPTHASLSSLRLEDGVLTHSVDGLSFLVTAIDYDHDPIGRLALGPLAAGADATQALAQLEHFKLSLDLILHARQRAHFAATMHLASIEESYGEVLRKNAALEQAFARLKELDHLKSSFLATISHELRTPLTSIIGYSEMLAEGMCGSLTKEQLEFVQTIRQKGDQLLRLILSLLDLSKLESGTLHMHPIAVPIEAVLQDAVSTISPIAAKKGVRVALEPGPPVPYLRADPDRLRQVFVNLVDNAVKFTPKGGEVLLSARALAAPSDGAGVVLLAPVRREVEVRVKDTGLGITAHERNRIFDPFYQVDQSSTREQGGAGLGLAIVKRIVEAHHGRITVEENSPRGSVFVVSLPYTGTSTTRARVEGP